MQVFPQKDALKYVFDFAFSLEIIIKSIFNYISHFIINY